MRFGKETWVGFGLVVEVLAILALALTGIWSQIWAEDLRVELDVARDSIEALHKAWPTDPCRLESEFRTPAGERLEVRICPVADSVGGK